MNIPVLLLAVAVPVLAMSMAVIDGDRVCFCVLPDRPLPLICVSRGWLGFDCPLCGVTRSIIYLVNREWEKSWAAHRLGWLILTLIVAQIPYQLFRDRWAAGEQATRQIRQTVLWGGLAALLVANRVWDVIF